MGVKVTIMVEDFGCDWITLELETDVNKIVTQDQQDLFPYLFGLILGDGIEATDRPYIIIIDYPCGKSHTKFKLLH